MLNRKIPKSHFFDGLVESNEPQSAEYLPVEGDKVESIIAADEMRRLNDFLVIFLSDLEQRFNSNVNEVEKYRKQYEKGLSPHQDNFTPFELEMTLLEHSFIGDYEYLAAEVALTCFFNRMELIFKYYQHYEVLPTPVKPSLNANLKNKNYLNEGFLSLCLHNLVDQGILSEEDLILPSIIKGRSIRNKFSHGKLVRVDFESCSLVSLFKESKMIFDKISNTTKVQA